MLTISKKNGANSTAGSTAKKGNKGRLELCAERDGENFRVRFEDYGNYGRIRWQADFGELSEDQLRAMIGDLEALLDGSEDTTAVEFIEPQPEPTPEVEAAAEEVEAEAESDEPEVPAEALEATESDTDQLEA
jgi:hypothetical protein